MRSLLRSIADGVLTIAIAIFGMALHFTLLSVFKAHVHRSSALQQYRPVYSRSGRRNRVRC